MKIEEIKKGGWIRDDDTGRLGTITEVRDNGFFARPDDVPYTVSSDNFVGVPGKLITATYWTINPDGTCRGLWFDSPLEHYVGVFAYGGPKE